MIFIPFNEFFNFFKCWVESDQQIQYTGDNRDLCNTVAVLQPTRPTLGTPSTRATTTTRMTTTTTLPTTTTTLRTTTTRRTRRTTTPQTRRTQPTVGTIATQIPLTSSKVVMDSSSSECSPINENEGQVTSVSQTPETTLQSMSDSTQRFKK